MIYTSYFLFYLIEYKEVNGLGDFDVHPLTIKKILMTKTFFFHYNYFGFFFFL
jgi:hypothetical protein